VDKRGNPSSAQLSIQVTQDSTSAVAGDAIEQAHESVKKLVQPLVSDASSALTNISDILSNQESIITSFNSLIKKFEPLIKIGDEVAKVCSHVSSYSLDDSILLFVQSDSSLRQFRVASTFRRNEGELKLLWFFSLYTSRSDGASPTSSRCEDSRSCQSDGEHLLLRGFSRPVEEIPCSSRHY
jgi:hypothetical protein